MHYLQLTTQCNGIRKDGKGHRDHRGTYEPCGPPPDGYADLVPCGTLANRWTKAVKSQERLAPSNTITLNEDLLSPSATPSGATPDKPYDE
jgi:hypothetical protein